MWLDRANTEHRLGTLHWPGAWMVAEADPEIPTQIPEVLFWKMF